MNREIYGFPSNLEKDADLDPDGSIAMEEWRNILKEMLWSFEQIAFDADTPAMRWYGEQYDVLIKQGVSHNEILFESKLQDLPLNIS